MQQEWLQLVEAELGAREQLLKVVDIVLFVRYRARIDFEDSNRLTLNAENFGQQRAAGPERKQIQKSRARHSPLHRI
jgi:hypothetical protein